MNEWAPLTEYRGWRREIRPINDVVFRYEVRMWRETWTEVVLYSRGTSYEGAVDHSMLRIDREISNLGS